MNNINYEAESHAIPFSKVIEAVNYMQYGSAERAMFEMLFLTGCRMRELNEMRKSMLFGNMLYWKLGKNQKSHRHIKLPDRYMAELRYYWEHNRIFHDMMFGISSNTLRRNFNKFIRPNLSKEWNEKMPCMSSGFLDLDFVYQLKGLRKDFQTLEFKNQLDKWDDAAVALEFTSKEMKHSSSRITAFHYIVNFDQLEINRYPNMTPQDILNSSQIQKRLLDFIPS